MYVCICRSVTDKQIRKAAAAGIDNLYDLRDTLGVASGCGTCAGAAEEIIEEALGHPSEPQLYVPSPA